MTRGPLDVIWIWDAASGFGSAVWRVHASTPARQSRDTEQSRVVPRRPLAKSRKTKRVKANLRQRRHPNNEISVTFHLGVLDIPPRPALSRQKVAELNRQLIPNAEALWRTRRRECHRLDLMTSVSLSSCSICGATAIPISCANRSRLSSEASG